MNALFSLLTSILVAISGVAHTSGFSFTKTIATSTPVVVDASGLPLRIPIFIYHTIANSKPTNTKAQEIYRTDPALLNEQLSYLDTHGYTTVTMKQVADMLRRGTTSPITHPVALTFDDGWVTQYNNALPILKKHKATAKKAPAVPITSSPIWTT